MLLGTIVSCNPQELHLSRQGTAFPWLARLAELQIATRMSRHKFFAHEKVQSLDSYGIIDAVWVAGTRSLTSRRFDGSLGGATDAELSVLFWVILSKTSKINHYEVDKTKRLD